MKLYKTLNEVYAEKDWVQNAYYTYKDSITPNDRRECVGCCLQGAIGLLSVSIVEEINLTIELVHRCRERYGAAIVGTNDRMLKIKKKCLT